MTEIRANVIQDMSYMARLSDPMVCADRVPLRSVSSGRDTVATLVRESGMSMWGEVVESLQAMGVWQLLFAFVACTGYALAHGRLVGPRAKWAALAMTALALVGFVLQTERWVDGVVLVAVGVAGLGIFVAVVWLTCHLLGVNAAGAPRSFDSLLSVPPADPDDGIAPGRAIAPPRRAAPSH